jgi:hypothetical protein
MTKPLLIASAMALAVLSAALPARAQMVNTRIGPVELQAGDPSKATVAWAG